MAIVDPFKSQQPASPAAPQVTRPKIKDPFARAAAPKITRSTLPAESQGFGSSFARGFKRSLPETMGLLHGAAATVAGAVGADRARDMNLGEYQRIQQESVEPLQSQASFAGVLSGDNGVGEWAGDTLGNFAGQAAQSVATGLAGAAIGSAGGPAGSVAGGVGGLLVRGAAKKVVANQVEKLVAQQVAKGAIRETAEAAAKQAVLGRIGGAALAGTGLNVAQETGIAYTGRAEDAQRDGQQLTQGDAVRALGFGVPAGLVDTAAEGLVAGRLMRGVSSDPNLLRRVGKAAGVGALTEGGTEGAQAVLERAGAARDLTGSDAYADYLENVAAGALGGGVAGGPAGLRRVQRPVLPQQDRREELAPTPDAPLLGLPAPNTTIQVDGQGNAFTAPMLAQEREAMGRDGQMLRDSGQTADVRAARQQHPGYADAPIVRRPAIPFPNAQPGSLADAGNALQRPFRNPVTVDGKTGRVLSSSPLPAQATRGEPLPFVAEPVQPPWIDTATGEQLEATPAMITEAVRQQMLAQRDRDGSMRISSPQLATAWGVSANRIKQARTAILQESSAAQRLGLPDPLAATPSAPAAEPAAAHSGPISYAAAMLQTRGDGSNEQAQASSGGGLAEASGIGDDASPAYRAGGELGGGLRGGGAVGGVASPRSAATQGETPTAISSPAAPAALPVTSEKTPAQAGVSASRVYDESPDILDDDITPSAGRPYTIEEAANMSARRGGAKAIPVDGGFVVRMPTIQPAEQSDERAGAGTPGAGGVEAVGGSGTAAAAAPDAAGAAAVAKPYPGGVAAAVAPQPSVAEPALEAPASGHTAAPAPPAAQGRLARQRTQAGEELVTFRRRNGGQVLVRRADVESGASPVLAVYNSAGAQLRSGIGSTVLRGDLLDAAPVGEKAGPQTYIPSAPQSGAAQQVQLQPAGEAGQLQAKPIAGDPLPVQEQPAAAGDAGAPQVDRRGDQAQRDAVDALPVDERDAEIQRLREQNAQLQRTLDTDSLTGTRSREAYRRDAPNAKGVAFIDLIAFKGYNTKFTETGGDAVLAVFGRELVDAAGDSAYRRGGDEFALLSDQSPEHAAELARAAQARMEQVVLRLNDKEGAAHEVRGIPFRYGVGDSDAAAVADSAARKVAGDRESNPNVVDLGAIGGDGGAVRGDGGLSVERALPERGRTFGSATGQELTEESPLSETPANAGVSRFGHLDHESQTRASDRIQRLAEDEGALPESTEQGLQVLRREGGEGLPAVAEVVPGVSGLDGRASGTGNVAGQDQHERQLRAGELSLGDGAAAGSESPLLQKGRAGREGTDLAGNKQGGAGSAHDAAPEDRARNPDRNGDKQGTAARSNELPIPGVRRGEADLAAVGQATRGSGADTSGKAAPKNAAESGVDAGPETPRDSVEQAAAEAATSPLNDRPEPTAAQKSAGNYKVGKVALHGLPISIENPAGTSRRPEWPPLANHYGYIRRTEGADGDHVDVFLGPGAEDASRPVFVIDQVDPKTKRFDEHKVIIGAASGREARKIYQANYAPGWKGFGAITNMSLDQFKTWLQGDTSKPANAEVSAPAAPRLRGGIAPNGARVKIVGGKPVYDLQSRETLEAYFKPGTLVASYGGGKDRVVDFTWGGDFGWSVRVQRADPKPAGVDSRSDGAWDVRAHTTAPSMRDVVDKLGPAQAVAPNSGAKKSASFSQSDSPSSGGIGEGAARDAVHEVTKEWGPAGPRVRVLMDPEKLPAAAKSDPDYVRAEGFYDGSHVYLVVPNLRSVERLRQVLAHEAVGHYGIDRIVDEHVDGGWAKLRDDIIRLRDQGLGSADMKAVLADVGRRYAGADADTFAKETLAVMAERDVRNGLISRAIAAVKAWLRKFMPSYTATEKQLRELLDKSKQLLRAGPNYAERAAAVQAMSFSQADPTDSQAFRDWFKKSKVGSTTTPQIVYHGTGDDFAVFQAARAGESTGHATSPLGFFFTPDRSLAQRYAVNASEGRPADARIMPVYLSIQNPYNMPLSEAQDVESMDDARVLRAKLEKQGYDGIRIKESNTWIAFNSEQVKSTANTGTFDSSSPNIYFSKPAASIDTLDAVLAAPDGGAWQRAKEWTAGKWQDVKPSALGALTLRHLLELAEPLLPGSKRYADLVQQIGADRNQMLETAGGLSDKLQKWARGGKLFGGYTAEARALFDLMHRSTIDGSDPSKEYQPLHFEDSRGRPVPFSAEAVKERKKALKEQIKGRPGDVMAEQVEQLKFLDKLPDIEAARRAAFPGLVAAWQRLSPQAQQHYAELRDYYVDHSNEVEKALVKRIDALEVAEEKKKALTARIRHQFETQRLQGVYFPLQRFGEFWVSATDKDGEHAYLMFENAKEWTRAQAKLKSAGFDITATGRKDQNYRAKDAPSGTFVADVIRQLQEAHVGEKVQDQVYQLFLKSLPELSMRKHSIHRKATAGFSDDAGRAFARNAFHGAHQLARLRHSHELQSILDAMQIMADGRRKDGLPPAEVNAMDALLGEMRRRHDWIMSPTDSKLANYASAIGFSYYLGLTPAAALVNLTQGALTTFPVLGAQHGFDKAARMLGAASRDAMRTWGNIDKTLTSDEERAAFQALLKSGDIQRTAAHNLAGIAEGSELQANPVYAKVMHGVSYTFQKMEEINRQAAGIAAFRMARSAGRDFNESVRYASEIINRTHYDFSNANRARFMQSAPAKVLLMFRQYALNTSWLIGRAAYKAFAGETPEVKREARRTLSGILGMSALFSGVMGLPFMGIAGTVANAIQAALGDDDEPWDFNTEVRNFLADKLGPDAARWVADGAVSRAGADVASRVSMSQMWFRDADKELEGQDAYYNLLEQAAGPMGGIVKNLLVGKKQVDDGHVWRGVETMMPKAVKDAMKSLRFADEGANTLRGDPVLDDITGGEKLVQLLGFSPTRLAEQYRVNRAVKNYEQHILDRRASLLSALAMSVRLQDEEMRTATLGKIQAFNTKYPELALSPRSIRQSLRARARYSAQAENGIVLNKRIAERARAEAGGFGG